MELNLDKLFLEPDPPEALPLGPVDEAASDDIALIDEPLKPWQRLSAALFATGTPIYHISPQVLQPVEAVSSFVTSRRGQIIIGQILTENKERLDSLLSAAAVDSLLTLIKIRDTSGSDTARISASKTLLDKTLPGVKARDAKGSPLAHAADNPEDEIARLQKRIKTI